jgi:hypothetical protein
LTDFYQTTPVTVIEQLTVNDTRNVRGVSDYYQTTSVTVIEHLTVNDTRNARE